MAPRLTRALADELRTLGQQISHGLPEVQRDMRAVASKAAAAIDEVIELFGEPTEDQYATARADKTTEPPVETPAPVPSAVETPTVVTGQ